MIELHLIPVSSIGRHAVVCCCPRYDATLDGTIADYPPSPRAEQFRVERIRQGKSLRDAARLLNMKMVDLSSLERGSATLSDEEWTVVLETIFGGG